ncbi:putative transmembrane protein [Toxoplasma gondii VEG]|uniref:Putative transmembrane protein n=2 Tax=Toxoplasma gondii TaxID=5811 RepID=B9QQG5_TOXGV|nr:putative transmembrane protein [Toxoplasma gondii VEG]KFG27865.1 putative transmembrane protein [Toxoplasma gondii p89]CEL77166.1 TPA: hypothetical protein BN1205_036740 [Toxoplasma gondii VEG]
MAALERPSALPRRTQSSPFPRKGLAAFSLFVLSTAALFGASAFAEASRPFRSPSAADGRTPPTGASSAAPSAGGKRAAGEAGAGEENERPENAIEAAHLGKPLAGSAAAAQSLEQQDLQRETENYGGNVNRELSKPAAAAHAAPPPVAVMTQLERRTAMEPGVTEREQRLERPLPKAARTATPRQLPRSSPGASTEFLRRAAKFTRSARARAELRNVCVSAIVAAGILVAILILNEVSPVSASAEVEASEEKEIEVEELQPEEHVEPETPKTPEAPAPQTSETRPGEATPEVAASGIRGRLAEALISAKMALKHPKMVAVTQPVLVLSRAIYTVIRVLFEVLETVASNEHLQTLGSSLLDFMPLMAAAVQRLASAAVVRAGSAAYQNAPGYYAKVKDAIQKKPIPKARKRAAATRDRFFP